MSKELFPWDIPKEIPRDSRQRRKLFLTADEHYFHRKILIYQNRDFPNISEMNETLQKNHNSIVKPDDVTIHIGDFSFGSPEQFSEMTKALHGTHYFMDGSHDRALRRVFSTPAHREKLEGIGYLLPKLFEFTFDQHKISLCHYSMTKWGCSHHGSLHFFGHSHGNHRPHNRSLDIGVDCHNFYPVEMSKAIKLVLDGQIEQNHPRTK